MLYLKGRWMHKVAITKIWKVKDRLDITIDYAINGEKQKKNYMYQV